MKNPILMKCTSRRARLWSAVAPFALALAWGGGAYAQVASSDRLTFGVTARAVHDTNLSGGNPAFGDARGIVPEDSWYSAGGYLTGRVPIGRQALFVNASGDIQRYEKNRVLDAENFSFLGGVSGRVGSCADSVSAQYSRQLTPNSELLLPIAKNIVSQKYIDGALTCNRGHLVAGLEARRTNVENSAHDSGLVNFNTTAVTGNVGYAGRELGTLSLLGQYTKVDYDQSTSFISDALGYTSYELGFRYYRTIGSRLSGTADLTYTHTKSAFDPRTALLVSGPVEFSGWSADVLMQYRVSPRTQVDLFYSRRVQPAQVVAIGFDLAQTARLSASHRFGSRIEAAAGGSSVRTNYSHGRTALLDLRSDDVRTVFANASLRLGPHARVTVDAQHVDREANLPVYTYKSDRIGITVAGEF